MAALGQAGYQPCHSPALLIEPLPVTAAMRRTLMDLDLYHGVFFASPNAARLALSAMADLWPQWPVGVHWLAVGRATAAELGQWQLTAEVPASGFNSEAVLALPCLQDIQEKKVLLCRGETGRELLAQTLQARGAEGSSLAFYRRQANPDFHCPPGCDWAMITSVESWHSVVSGLPAGCGVIAAGERVAAQIRASFDGTVITAASAHDDDMLAALPALQ